MRRHNKDFKTTLNFKFNLNGFRGKNPDSLMLLLIGVQKEVSINDTQVDVFESKQRQVIC
jgi:hypothetical protein